MAGKGLGAGLGALFGEETMDEGREGSLSVPISRVEPRGDQPRKTFDPEALEELAASIREHGIIQPITVQKLDGGYFQIIAGERRWRAARLAGLGEVPVRVLEVGEKSAAELALVENLQREDLNPAEEAKGYRALMDNFGMTQEQVAARIGKSRPVIANALRLLSLPEPVLSYVESGALSLSHARAILELDGEKRRIEAAEKIMKDGLTVREATLLIKKMAKGAGEKGKPKKTGVQVDYIKEVEERLSKKIGRRVNVTSGRKKGHIDIEFYGPEDFEHVCAAIEKLEMILGEKDG